MSTPSDDTNRPHNAGELETLINALQARVHHQNKLSNIIREAAKR